VHSPTHLFMLPGVLMIALGLLAGMISLLNVEIFGRPWMLHTTVGAALLVIVGTQVLALGLCAHAYGTYFMNEKDEWFDRMRQRFRLEHGLVFGGAIILAGLAVAALIAAIWADRGFGELGEERLAVVAATLIIVGLQVFFTSFLLSILGLRRRR
jgi:hypothetical protein